MKYIMRGNFVNDKIKRFVLTYIKEIFRDVTLKNDVVEVLTKLREKGFEIILITARGPRSFLEAEELTIKYLNQNKVPYDNIIFNAYDKYEEIIENKIDVMIDDSIEICEDLSRRGIRAYLFTTEVNVNQKSSVPRIANWIELEEKIINLSTV
jgi:uncharacterized HAD superfamily protein